MLTLAQIKENPQEVIKRLAVKGFDGKEAIERVIAAADARRKQQLENDTLAAELKKLAASIGALMKQGAKEEAEAAKAKVATLKEQQK
nr:serine--tRNA ligase [Muribaculaceae bacterium]